MVLLYQLWLALSERKVMNKNRVNGSIVEKNGTWYARLYVTNENGKRKQIWRTTKLPVKNNKRKAEAFLQDLIEQYSKECKTFYSEITVADYFELWLNDIKSEVRILTEITKEIWKSILSHIFVKKVYDYRN